MPQTGWPIARLDRTLRRPQLARVHPLYAREQLRTAYEMPDGDEVEALAGRARRELTAAVRLPRRSDAGGQRCRPDVHAPHPCREPRWI
jgi:hypothetical protein